jgi:hypothetical protein
MKWIMKKDIKRQRCVRLWDGGRQSSTPFKPNGILK